MAEEDFFNLKESKTADVFGAITRCFDVRKSNAALAAAKPKSYLRRTKKKTNLEGEQETKHTPLLVYWYTILFSI